MPRQPRFLTGPGDAPQRHSAASLRSAATKGVDHTKAPRHEEDREEHVPDFVALWLRVRTDSFHCRDFRSMGVASLGFSVASVSRRRAIVRNEANLRAVSSLKCQVFSRRDAKCAKQSQFVDGGFGGNCCLGKGLGEEMGVGAVRERSQLASFGSFERRARREPSEDFSGFTLQT